MQILRYTWHKLRVLKNFSCYVIPHLMRNLKKLDSRFRGNDMGAEQGSIIITFFSALKLKESFFIFFLLAFIHASANGVFAQSVDEGKAIFQKICVACHTIGEGKRVGPDLKGVTERRDIQWLKGYIQSPSSYFKKNDEIATALLKEYKVPMPDPGLKEEEVEAVIAFLKGSDIQGKVAMGAPSQYIPTVAVSVGGVIILTLIGLMAGTKKVEVR